MSLRVCTWCIVAALALFVTPAVASSPANGAESLEEVSVRDVVNLLGEWRVGVVVVLAAIVLAVLWAGEVIRPESLTKAGLRDTKPIPAFIWLFSGVIVLTASAASAGFVRDTGLLDSVQLSDMHRNIAETVVVGLLAAATALVMTYILKKSAPKAGLRIRSSDLLLGLGCFVLAFPLVESINISAYHAYEAIRDEAPPRIAHPTLQLIIDHRADPWIWLLIGSVVLLTPIVEEIVYRAFLQSSLLRMWNSPWMAIVVTAVLFALAHRLGPQPVPWHALFPLCMLGLCLGVAYERTKQLGVPIAMHMAFNALNITIALLSAEPAA